MATAPAWHGAFPALWLPAGRVSCAGQSVTAAGKGDSYQGKGKQQPGSLLSVPSIWAARADAECCWGTGRQPGEGCSAVLSAGTSPAVAVPLTQSCRDGCPEGASRSHFSLGVSEELLQRAGGSALPRCAMQLSRAATQSSVCPQPAVLQSQEGSFCTQLPCDSSWEDLVVS